MKSCSKVGGSQSPACSTDELYLVAASEDVIANLPNSAAAAGQQKNGIVSNDVDRTDCLSEIIPRDEIPTLTSVSKAVRICVRRKINVIELLLVVGKFGKRIWGSYYVHNRVHVVHLGNRLDLADFNVTNVFAGAKNQQCFHKA